MCWFTLPALLVRAMSLQVLQFSSGAFALSCPFGCHRNVFSAVRTERRNTSLTRVEFKGHLTEREPSKHAKHNKHKHRKHIEAEDSEQKSGMHHERSTVTLTSLEPNVLLQTDLPRENAACTHTVCPSNGVWLLRGLRCSRKRCCCWRCFGLDCPNGTLPVALPWGVDARLAWGGHASGADVPWGTVTELAHLSDD